VAYFVRYASEVSEFANIVIFTYYRSLTGVIVTNYIYPQWRRNEFKSGGTGPERKWGGVHRSGAKRRKNFFCRATPLVWL